MLKANTKKASCQGGGGAHPLNPSPRSAPEAGVQAGRDSEGKEITGT